MDIEVWCQLIDAFFELPGANSANSAKKSETKMKELVVDAKFDWSLAMTPKDTTPTFTTMDQFLTMLQSDFEIALSPMVRNTYIADLQADQNNHKARVRALNGCEVMLAFQNLKPNETYGLKYFGRDMHEKLFKCDIAAKPLSVFKLYAARIRKQA
jgi:hypothetical protein